MAGDLGELRSVGFDLGLRLVGECDDEAYTAIAGLLCPLSNLPWRWTT